MSAVLAAGSLGLGVCAVSLAGDPAPTPLPDSPPHDLRGGGLVEQRGEKVGRVRDMARCRGRDTEFAERCERRPYPRTTLALRDVRAHGLRVTVPRSFAVEVRALRHGELLEGWYGGTRIIDYGAVREWEIWPRGHPYRAARKPPPARADALRIVAHGDRGAKGFELAIP